MAALVYLVVILAVTTSASEADKLFDVLQARGLGDDSGRVLGQAGGVAGVIQGQPGTGQNQGSGLGKARDVEGRDVEGRDMEERDVEGRDVEGRDVEERDAETALDEELAPGRTVRQAGSRYRTHVISRLNSVDRRISTLINVLTNLSAKLEATRQNVSTALDLACTDVRVRLVGGASSSQGRVEISINGGAWGTVCQRRWDNNDATVVCRMLGYRSGTARLNAYFGQGTGNILLDLVNCSGREYNIMQCRLPPFGVHSCGHHMDAGAICV